MINALHLLGLVFNIWGALMLVVMVDRDLTFIIKNMNRLVGEDWEDKIQKILKHKKLYAALGIIFLIGGYFCEWEASIP